MSAVAHCNPGATVIDRRYSRIVLLLCVYSDSIPWYGREAMSEREKLVSGLKLAWRDEMGSARNYRALAEQEAHPDRRDILLRLAEAEEKHAAPRAARLGELGAE